MQSDRRIKLLFSNSVMNHVVYAELVHLGIKMSVMVFQKNMLTLIIKE